MKKYRALGKSILENTHCNLRRNLLMLCNDYYIRKLIGFKGIILEQLETSSDSMSFSFSLEIKTHNCPKCHQQTSKVHDYRIQMIKDISISGKKTYLYYKKRRYVCNHCNKKFYEKNDFLPRYQRMTSRLIKYIITRMKNVYSVSDIAKENNISPSTALRLFRFINYSLTKLPEVISIDEFK
ncbi:MAG: transposase family protein, partial [Eubacteriales bacterium]|nr:transposase family protein [Eubacteriales bacterium]